VAVWRRNEEKTVGFRRRAEYDRAVTEFQQQAAPLSMSSLKKADLHMHSTASDGRLSPDALVAEAVHGGLDLVSLTDHDTILGWHAFEQAARAAGLACIPGVEISARQAGVEVHLLGYGFDPGHPVLSGFLTLQQQRRNERAHEFLRLLKLAGILPRDAALQQVPAGTSWARPHIARLLMDHGSVGSMDEAFEQYLVSGTETFVPKPLPSGEEAIDVIHAAGGIIGLAHPGHHVPHQVVLGLIEAGLDAIETVHPSHDRMLTGYYASLAERFGLLMTGGSDYHARKGHREQRLGERWFTPKPALLDALRTH
jgi:predicted metal-dependent phosphoesterase TrpH